MEFYQLTQKSNQTVEQMGIELQKLAQKAFPTITGKDIDRLLKGRFFQALLPVWQRKLGAPKTEETLSDLFNRARTFECREKKYSESAEGRGKRASQKPSYLETTNKPSTELPPKSTVVRLGI